MYKLATDCNNAAPPNSDGTLCLCVCKASGILTGNIFIYFFNMGATLLFPLAIILHNFLIPNPVLHRRFRQLRKGIYLYLFKRYLFVYLFLGKQIFHLKVKNISTGKVQSVQCQFCP